MEKEFWLNKWEKGEIGFHQENYNPYLVSYWDKITKDKGAVFVPLCGKTKDMHYLSELGHKVIGVELSMDAAKTFFLDNKLSYNVSTKMTKENKEFSLLEGKNISIYVGNLFDLDPSWAVDCTYLYDRASLVALPKKMRQRYGDFILKLNLKDGLVITMEFEEDCGPPFSISLEELKSILKLDTESIDLLEIKNEKDDEVDVHKGKLKSRKEYALHLNLKGA